MINLNSLVRNLSALYPPPNALSTSFLPRGASLPFARFVCRLFAARSPFAVLRQEFYGLCDLFLEKLPLGGIPVGLG